MIILILLTLATIFWILAARFSYDGELWFGLPAVVFTILSILSLVAYPISKMSDRELIAEYYAAQEMLAYSRQSSDPLERAAVIHQIISINKKLTLSRYYNNSWIFGPYVTDELVTLAPIN